MFLSQNKKKMSMPKQKPSVKSSTKSKKIDVDENPFLSAESTQQSKKKDIRQEQDEILDIMIDKLDTVKTINSEINSELKEHEKIIANVDADVENTNNRIAHANRRIKSLLNDPKECRKMSLIVALVIIIVILIFILVYVNPKN